MISGGYSTGDNPLLAMSPSDWFKLAIFAAGSIFALIFFILTFFSIAEAISRAIFDSADYNDGTSSEYSFMEAAPVPDGVEFKVSTSDGVKYLLITGVRQVLIKTIRDRSKIPPADQNPIVLEAKDIEVAVGPVAENNSRSIIGQVTSDAFVLWLTHSGLKNGPPQKLTRGDLRFGSLTFHTSALEIEETSRSLDQTARGQAELQTVYIIGNLVKITRGAVHQTATDRLFLNVAGSGEDTLLLDTEFNTNRLLRDLVGSSKETTLLNAGFDKDTLLLDVGFDKAVEAWKTQSRQANVLVSQSHHPARHDPQRRVVRGK